MHTKMKGEGIKGLFIEQIVPVMERHGYHFMKAKNVFVYEDREWKNECILRFTIGRMISCLCVRSTL